MEEELLEFPCFYGIKAMGLAHEDFVDHVVGILSRHVPKPAPDSISVRESSAQKYYSVTVEVRVTSREQLELLYAELKASERVLYLL